MLLFLMLFILYFISKRGTFTSTFLSLAFVYFSVFYIYPLSLIVGKNYFNYIGKSYALTSSDIALAISSAILLILGFIIPDLILVLKKRKKRVTSDLWNIPYSTNKNYNFKKMFYILAVIVIGTYVFKYLDPSRAIKAYEVRTGSAEGSMLVFLYGILINSLFFCLLFSLIYARKKKATFFTLFFALIFLLSGATGRAKLLINTLLLLMHTFKIKARLVILSSIFIFILILPIILNLKAIIYDISVSSKLPNILDFYLEDLDVDLIMSNLGHPLVSLLEAQNIIDKIGFRFLYDYLHGFLFYLRAFGFDFGDSLIYINTENILGVRESIIPTGYLAFGYMQLSYIGVIISGTFYRTVGFLAEYVYNKIQVENEVVKFYLSFMAASSFYHGEVRVMVITFFIPLFIIYFFRPSKLISNAS